MDSSPLTGRYDARLNGLNETLELEQAWTFRAALCALFEEYPVSLEEARRLYPEVDGVKLLHTWRARALEEVQNPAYAIYMADGTGIPQDVLISFARLVVG